MQLWAFIFMETLPASFMYFSSETETKNYIEEAGKTWKWKLSGAVVLFGLWTITSKRNETTTTYYWFADSFDWCNVKIPCKEIKTNLVLITAMQNRKILLVFQLQGELY